jgi:hypothetical protein
VLVKRRVTNKGMNKQIIAEARFPINVRVSRVWDALIDPDVLKQYLFGTNVISNWKEGSPIVRKGEWKIQNEAINGQKWYTLE